MSEPLALTLPTELADEIVERVLERLGDQNGSSPWLTRAEAAEYMRLPVSRLEKDRTIPCHHAQRRVLYHRDELDAYLIR
jgi:hypothetical protein